MGMPAVPAEVVYEEGIYVGYRYYNTFKVQPAYAFGYGLSYTNFSYSNIKLSSPVFNKPVTLTIDITNTGKAAGKEAVQLYITAPAGTLQKPSEELKAFAKTKLLQPGEKQTLSFTIHKDALSSFDTDKTSWVADAGKYTVKIGASSLDIKQTASFSLPKSIVTEKCNKVLVPQAVINEINK